LIFAIPIKNYNVQAKTKPSVVTQKQKQFDKAFRKAFNKYRKSLNIGRLKTDNGLIKASKTRAKELTIDFSHTRPQRKELIKLCDKT